MHIVTYVLHCYRSIFDLGPHMGGRVPFQLLKSEWERMGLGQPHKHWLED